VSLELPETCLVDPPGPLSDMKGGGHLFPIMFLYDPTSSVSNRLKRD